MKTQVKINDAFQLRKVRHSRARKVKQPTPVQKVDPNKSKSDLPLTKEQQSEEEMLHKFDLNWEYGPAKGVTRLERWERAKNLGLNPPPVIKDVISKSRLKNINKCVWDRKYSNVL